jgi:hypothetical protein
MESPCFTLREAAAYARTSTHTSQNRLEACDLNRNGSGSPLIFKAAHKADGFLAASLSAHDAYLGKL